MSAVRRRWPWVMLLGGEALFALCAWSGVVVSPRLVPYSAQVSLPLWLPLVVLAVAWGHTSPRMRRGVTPLLWFVLPLTMGVCSVAFAMNVGVRERALPPLAVGEERLHLVEHRVTKWDPSESVGCTEIRASLLFGLASQGIGLASCEQVGGDWPSALGRLSATPGPNPRTVMLSLAHVNPEFLPIHRGPFRVGAGGQYVRVSPAR